MRVTYQRDSLFRVQLLGEQPQEFIKQLTLFSQVYSTRDVRFVRPDSLSSLYSLCRRFHIDFEPLPEFLRSLASVSKFRTIFSNNRSANFSHFLDKAENPITVITHLPLFQQWKDFSVDRVISYEQAASQSVSPALIIEQPGQSMQGLLKKLCRMKGTVCLLKGRLQHVDRTGKRKLLECLLPTFDSDRYLNKQYQDQLERVFNSIADYSTPVHRIYQLRTPLSQLQCQKISQLHASLPALAKAFRSPQGVSSLYKDYYHVPAYQSALDQIFELLGESKVATAQTMLKKASKVVFVYLFQKVLQKLVMSLKDLGIKCAVFSQTTDPEIESMMIEKFNEGFFSLAVVYHRRDTSLIHKLNPNLVVVIDLHWNKSYYNCIKECRQVVILASSHSYEQLILSQLLQTKKQADFEIVLKRKQKEQSSVKQWAVVLQEGKTYQLNYE